MKSAIIASLIASAAAFAPTQTGVSREFALNAVKKAPVKKAPVKKAPVKKVAPKAAPKKVVKKGAVASFDTAVGATLPLGFFDPLGLVADGDQAKFDRLRLVEIKHGRISMLAIVGYLVQEAGYRLPGNIDLSGTKFADIPNGYAGLEAISYAGKLQIFAFIGALEVFVMRDFVGGEFPGDLRNNYIDFGWDSFDEATKLRKRTIELNQGRAAQMGILALMVHEQLGVSLLPFGSSTSEYVF
jgi:Chlorophyll A-B binding protein